MTFLPVALRHATALEAAPTRPVAHLRFDFTDLAAALLLIPSRLTAAFLALLLAAGVFASQETSDTGLNFNHFIFVLDCVVHCLLNLR